VFIFALVVALALADFIWLWTSHDIYFSTTGL